jgi:putative peptidoglycan lipid II flippase
MGLLRNRVLAREFGAGRELDAYNAAFQIPDLAFGLLVGGGLSAAFIPVFVRLRQEDPDGAQRFGQTVVTGAILAMAGAAAVMFIAAPWLAGVVVPGFDAGQRDLYVSLLRLLLATEVIFAASNALGEVLVADRRFLWYALALPTYNGGIVVGTLLLSGPLGIAAPAVGAVAGALAHLLIRIWGVRRRTEFRLRPRLEVRTAAFGEFIRLMVPKMMGHPIEPASVLFFSYLASLLAVGSLTVVSFARDFQSVPVVLIGAQFSLAIFPALTAAYAVGDRRAFVGMLGRNLLTIGLLSAAGAAALALFGPFVIERFLGGGAFDQDDVARTSLVLSIFALSVPFESLTYPLSRALYATRNTLLAVVASLCGFAVTVVLGLSLAPTLGIVAIPICFTAGSAVKLVLLGLALAYRLGRVGATTMNLPSRSG